MLPLPPNEPSDSAGHPIGASGAPGVACASAIAREELVVLVVDLVESVRLMQTDETMTVRYWTEFVRIVRSEILPAFSGALIKSLGDGLMVRFTSVRSAAAAAARMHLHFEALNRGLPDTRHMRLRAGINSTHVWSDDVDIYGSGINLAARLASLAGPGETVASEAARLELAAALADRAAPGETIASATARDELIDGFDASCEDLGECVLKHFNAPVRAYRIGAPGPRPSLAGVRDYGAQMDPTIAVIPFTPRTADPAHVDIGNLLADSVIWRLSRAPHLKVISRLSTSPIAGRADAPAQALVHLGANYALSGGFFVLGDRLVITAELADTQTGRVVWTERLAESVEDLFRPESVLAGRIAEAAHAAVFDAAVERVLSQPMPTLSSYSLLLSSIKLMHRSNRAEFLMTRRLLDELIHRHTRIAAPYTWLGNWFVLLTTRGWSQDRRSEAAQALDATRAALDRDPSDTLALTTEGFIHCHLLGDLDTARARCSLAVSMNPSQALGWLHLGVVQAFRGHAVDALDATRRAISLSPLDPQRYYFESLGATAELSARNFAKAEALARSSLALNRMHASTWRVLTIALAAQDRIDEARTALEHVRLLDPSLTVNRYLARIPNADLETGREWSRHLAAAGLPD